MDNQPAIENNLPAPNFTLPDLKGQPHSLKDYLGHIVILNFWSAECPWSSRYDQIISENLPVWGHAVQYLPIASNVNESQELIANEASTRELTLLLHDVDHKVADLYGAITTPHLFVIDAQGILRYQGAFDDVTFRQRTPTQNYLHMAVEAIKDDKLPEPDHTSPYGCTVVRATP
ncbi:MAG: redoxin domain-containing protein [Anaerolineales bacterium]